MGCCLKPSNGLPEHWDDHTVPFFLGKFCTSQAPPRSRGFLGFLPAMVSSASQQSSLVSTCKAIAYALFAHRLRTPDAQSRRAVAYGDALSATNRALQDRRERLRDETLTAIWLLSIYEVGVVLESLTSLQICSLACRSWLVQSPCLARVGRLAGMHTSRASSHCCVFERLTV